MVIPLVIVLLLRHTYLVPSRVSCLADKPARVVVLTMVRVACASDRFSICVAGCGSALSR